MPDQPSATDSASRQGRLEADQFDQLLRQRERRELQERWSRRFPREPSNHSPSRSDQVLDLQTLDRLERLTQFHGAVLNSRSWRILQALRRLLGRQW